MLRTISHIAGREMRRRERGWERPKAMMPCARGPNNRCGLTSGSGLTAVDVMRPAGVGQTTSRGRAQPPVGKRYRPNAVNPPQRKCPFGQIALPIPSRSIGHGDGSLGCVTLTVGANPAT